VGTSCRDDDSWRKPGVGRRVAAVMPDRREPDRILHEMFEMMVDDVRAYRSSSKQPMFSKP
jgi:hypothetical protein